MNISPGAVRHTFTKMWQTCCLGTLLFAAVFQGYHVRGYSTGAPAGACDKLDPYGHGPSTATGPALYALHFSTTSYTPNSKIQVNLTGTGGAQFKGFLIIARAADGGALDAVGSFQPAAGTKTDCASKLGNGITHTSGAVKSSEVFAWTAPSTPQGDLIFHYTVVRSGAPATTMNLTDYFEDLKSVRISGPPPVPAGKFSQDPGCGVSKGCFSNCENQVCDWESSWEEQGSDYRIVLRSTFSADNKYLSLGFNSLLGKMAPASVVSCTIFNNTAQVVVSSNVGFDNIPLNNTQEGISNVTVSDNNGLLECSFLRETTSFNPQIYNLTQDYYFIVARGNAKSGTLLTYHESRHYSSRIIRPANKTTDISFPTDRTTPVPGSTTTAPAAGKFPKDPACGTTKGCYSDCSSDGCEFLAAWQSQGEHFLITLKKTFGSADNNWIALGFSEKKAMDPASVVECTVHNSVVNAFVSVNPGLYNQRLNPQEGISNVTGSYENGLLQCSFLRVKNSSNPDIYDLANSYYLITAWGDVGSSGNLNPHNGRDRFMTSRRVDASDPSIDIDTEATKYPMIKAHACLMILAWMMSASIGLALARFYKKLWPDNTFCGLKVWFSIHRGAMVLAFLMGITAFIIIFVEVDGYSDIIGEDYKKAHPILGIIVTGLLFINPFMSLLRCGPDHPKRPLFNYAHWAVGTSAHILAGVTIAFGLYLPKAQVDHDEGLIVMIIYGAWHFTYFVIMTILDLMSKPNESKNVVGAAASPTELTGVKPLSPAANFKSTGDTYELSKGESKQDIMGGYTEINASKTPPKSGAKKFMLACHIIVLTTLSTYLMYMIIDGNV